MSRDANRFQQAERGVYRRPVPRLQRMPAASPAREAAQRPSVTLPTQANDEPLAAKLPAPSAATLPVAVPSVTVQSPAREAAALVVTPAASVEGLVVSRSKAVTAPAAVSHAGSRLGSARVIETSAPDMVPVVDVLVPPRTSPPRLSPVEIEGTHTGGLGRRAENAQKGIIAHIMRGVGSGALAVVAVFFCWLIYDTWREIYERPDGVAGLSSYHQRG